MRKWVYSLTIILLMSFFVIETISVGTHFIYPVTVSFLLLTLILFSNITIESYRSGVMMKYVEYFYFFSISLLMSAVSFVILVRNLTYTTFNIIYFYEFKYIEIILLTFALYLVKDEVKKKRFYISFLLFLMVNIYLVFSFFKIDYIKFIPIIMFIGLYLMYSFSATKSIKYLVTEILEYSIVSEVLFFLYLDSNRLSLYVASLFLFLASLIRVLKFFNELIKRDYYRSQYSKEKKANKLISLNEKPILVLQGYTIKKANKASLKLFGLDSLGDIKNQNLFNFISARDLGGYNLDKKLEEGRRKITIRPLNSQETKRMVDVYRVKGLAESEYILEFREEADFGELFYELNDKLDIIVYIYEKDVGYTYVSRGVEKILGYKPEEFYGDKVLGFKISLDNKFEDILKQQDGDTFLFTGQYRAKSGEVMHLKENVKYLNIGDREFYYGVIADVSDFVGEVKTIRKINEELLEQNKKKDMSMSIVSHEIRTPITAIIGFLENILINNSDIDKRISSMIEKVYSNSMRLKELVNNLLDLNKLNAGKLELYVEKDDLVSLVNEVLLNNETLLEIKKLKCINRLEGKVEIEADSSMLYQIINNVVSNCIKYNKEEGKIIVDKEENKEEVVLKIEDTGVGILEDNREKVFMEYERVKGIKEKGTGLGLPLSKKLIELNGGKIWFESEVDKGTTFYLLFKKP